MKKFTLTLLTFLTLSAATPVYSAVTADTKKEEVKKENVISDEEAEALVARLHEINDLDKSKLSKEERGELRSEVMSIREQLEGHPVIYVSGSLILLIILLIILL